MKLLFSLLILFLITPVNPANASFMDATINDFGGSFGVTIECLNSDQQGFSIYKEDFTFIGNTECIDGGAPFFTPETTIFDSQGTVFYFMFSDSDDLFIAQNLLFTDACDPDDPAINKGVGIIDTRIWSGNLGAVCPSFAITSTVDPDIQAQVNQLAADTIASLIAEFLNAVVIGGGGILLTIMAVYFLIKHIKHISSDKYYED